METFVRETLAGNITDIREARAKIQQKFGLDNRDWYVLKGRLQKALDTTESVDDNTVFEPVEAAQSTPPESDSLLTLPSHVPQDCKDVFNKMLLINSQQESRISLLSVENQSLKAEISRLYARNRWLTKLVGEAVSAP
jgi:hypothetical protein